MGCLRNACAAARVCEAIDGSVVVVPAGERWPSGSLRPAQDYLGAGAIISSFGSARLSPEAKAAVAVFKDARPRLRGTLLDFASGRELSEIGYAGDIEIAASLDVSDTVPQLHRDSFGPPR